MRTSETLRAATLAYCRQIIVLLVVLICTANVTNSVLLRDGFHERAGDAGHPAPALSIGPSLIDMMNGTAPRPFAYRSIPVRIARHASEHMEPAVRDRLFRSIMHHDTLHTRYFHALSDDVWTPVVALTYHVIYALVVISMLGALGYVYRLARMHGYSFGESLGMLVGFSIVYPLTFQQGAYYYDFLELVGAFAACYFVLRHAMTAATCVVFALSFAKESSFLVPIALLFLQPSQRSMRDRFAWFAIQMAGALATRNLILDAWADSPPSVSAFDLMSTLRTWFDPASYLRFYDVLGAGILTPGLQNPVLLLPAFVFFGACWRRAGRRYRGYFVAALVPLLLPLVMIGQRAEARTLSLAIPAFVLLSLAGGRKLSAVFAPCEVTSVCPTLRRRLRKACASHTRLRRLRLRHSPWRGYRPRRRH